MQAYTEKTGNHLYGWIATLPSQTIFRKGRVEDRFFFFMWKWDNIAFSFFCGIGKGRKEGGVMGGCIY